ncbi:putative ribosomal protein S26e [Lupinus albus]|uniref:40S ribosomal protein S26 n=1 Tax=Lupinus albus TaxID=3870 RepID=A0A6A4Q0F8_LUPAL|nr:putative ribosomal protein S26e [Lupinus albus]
MYDLVVPHSPFSLLTYFSFSTFAFALVLTYSLKHRNGGRNKHGRDHIKFIRCSNLWKTFPQDNFSFCRFYVNDHKMFYEISK